MSKTTNRDSAPRDGGSVEHRLARLLDTPFLARVVPHLPPETLHQLIRYRGLEACSEIVTSATPAQLTSLLDLDLWRHAQPGRDEQFDVERFGEWLEVLVNTGDSVAARTVAALDQDVVIAGLSRCVRVFDPGIFEPVAQSDDEAVDRHEAMREGDALMVGEASDLDEAMDAVSMDANHAPMRDGIGDRLECEVGGYIVRARRTDAWDAIVALLLALDAEHDGYFHAVMQGCRHLSNSRPEIDGLDDRLRAPEQHLHDVAIEREHRRSQQGYATPADARAFLQMARQPRHTRLEASAMGSIAANPIVTAYFRAADEAPESSSETTRSPERMLESSTSTSTSASASASTSTSTLTSAAAAAAAAKASHSTDEHGDATDVPASIDAVIELLTEAGVMPQRPRALLEAADSDPQTARLAQLQRLMAYVHDTHETAYLTRSRELAFLANVLLAGCSVQSRPFTPQEASDAAAGICNLGLERWPTGSPPDSFLIDRDLVTVFEVGWSVLHQEVSLFVAEQLISMLDDLPCADRDIQRGLVTLRRALVKQRDAGTPWLARHAADVLAMLDMTAWVSVLGLLDECPVLPAALTANLEGRTTTVSPTAFEFIATTAQIGDIRLFMRKLPDVLSR